MNVLLLQIVVNVFMVMVVVCAWGILGQVVLISGSITTPAIAIVAAVTTVAAISAIISLAPTMTMVRVVFMVVVLMSLVEMIDNSFVNPFKAFKESCIGCDVEVD